jgi:hypothetical protein
MASFNGCPSGCPEGRDGRASERDRMRGINLVRDFSSPKLNSMRHLHSHKVNPYC